MDKAVFDLFDHAATNLQATMESFSLAIEGAYAKRYRDDPSIRGLNAFLRSTESISVIAEATASSALQRYAVNMQGFHRPTPPYPVETPSEIAPIVARQLRNTIDTLRMLAARRFKAALVGRLSAVVPGTDGVRLMNRAGKSFRASEMTYLTARKAVIDMFNEGQIEILSSLDYSIGYVYTKNAENKLHGAALTFAPAESETMPSYAAVESSWFHPRSNAIIVGEM